MKDREEKSLIQGQLVKVREEKQAAVQEMRSRGAGVSITIMEEDDG